MWHRSCACMDEIQNSVSKFTKYWTTIDCVLCHSMPHGGLWIISSSINQLCVIISNTVLRYSHRWATFKLVLVLLQIFIAISFWLVFSNMQNIFLYCIVLYCMLCRTFTREFEAQEKRNYTHAKFSLFTELDEVDQLFDLNCSCIMLASLCKTYFTA